MRQFPKRALALRAGLHLASSGAIGFPYVTGARQWFVCVVDLREQGKEIVRCLRLPASTVQGNLAHSRRTLLGRTVGPDPRLSGGMFWISLRVLRRYSLGGGACMAAVLVVIEVSLALCATG